MSNELLNVYARMGCPCGEEATMEEVADWAGRIINDQLARESKAEKRVRELETAIRNCINYANNRESEWGTRAMSAFNFILTAIGEPTRKEQK